MSKSQNILKIYEHNSTLPIKTFNKSQLFIWDFLLSRQDQQVNGHFLDIGVFFWNISVHDGITPKKV